MLFDLRDASQAEENTRQDLKERSAWAHVTSRPGEIKLATSSDRREIRWSRTWRKVHQCCRSSLTRSIAWVSDCDKQAGRTNRGFSLRRKSTAALRAPNCVLHPGEGWAYSVAAEAAAASSSDWSWRSHPDRVCLDRLKAAGSMEAAVVRPSALMVREIGSGMWSRSAQLKIS
jgi:hypothetical protein